MSVDVRDVKQPPPGGRTVDLEPSLVDTVASEGAGPLPERDFESGDALGRYTLRRRIGSGAMGVVYEAHDPDLDRTIAIKVLRRRRDIDPKEQSAGELRLLREAQALARLSHPNVVPVYDVGLTDDGTRISRVYIAMEFVRGKTLREWLEGDHDWRAIVAVLLDAGRGLVAAHAAELVHRDFKPDNVLIDESGRARVMDFGLARGATPSADRPPSISGEEIDSLSASLTRTGSMVGTPIYMAPEQHFALEVDEAADQYAFCVVAFESLFGTRPFHAKDIHALARAKMTGEPAAVELGDVPDAVHAIILRGLEMKVTDRWPSMRELLAALGRAVPHAGRPRWMWMAAAGVIVAAGVAAYATGSGSTCRSGAERWDAVWNRTEKKRIKAAFAATETTIAAAQLAHVATSLDAYGEAWTASYRETCDAFADGDTSASLDRRMLCLDRRLGEVESLLIVLGEVDLEGVMRASSLVIGLRPVSVCESPEGVDVELPPGAEQAELVEHAWRLIDLASARDRAGDSRSALADATAAYLLATQSGHQPTVARAAEELADAYSALGRYAYAEALYEESLVIARSSPGQEAQALSAIAHLVFLTGHRLDRYEDGLEWARMGRALLEREGSPVGARIKLLENEAIVLSDTGDNEAALAQLEEALHLRTTQMPEHEVGMAMLQNNIGTTLSDLGRYDEARLAHERALEIRSRVLGSSHPDIAMSFANLAGAHMRKGDYHDAIRLAEQAHAIVVQAYGARHPLAATMQNVVGSAHMNLGNHVEAERILREVIEIREETLGETHSSLADAYGNLGAVYMGAGKPEEAERTFQHALTLIQGTSSNRQSAWMHYNLGSALLERKQYDKAEERLTIALEQWERYRGPDHPELSYPLMTLARVRLEQEDAETAIDLLERAHDLRGGDEGPQGTVGDFLLGRALFETGRDPARGWALAQTARDALATAPAPYEPERKMVAQWLEQARPQASRLGLESPPG